MPSDTKLIWTKYSTCQREWLEILLEIYDELVYINNLKRLLICGLIMFDIA